MKEAEGGERLRGRGGEMRLGESLWGDERG